MEATLAYREHLDGHFHSHQDFNESPTPAKEH